MNGRVIGYNLYRTTGGELRMVGTQAARRTFPWLHVLHWTVWIALLLAPAAVIVHYEMQTAKASGPAERAIEDGKAREAQEVQRLERQIGRRIGDLP